MNAPGVVDPEVWATDVVIGDGGVVRLRPLRREDGPALLELAARLSDEAVRFRFVTAWRPRTEADLEPFFLPPFRREFIFRST